MNDPHVEELYYSVGTGNDRISYGEPPPLEFERNDIGKFRLADGLLTVELSEHFPDQEAARQVVDPFVRAWKLHTDLTANVGQIRFKFKDAKIIDRNPPPPGINRVIQVRGVSTVEIAGRVGIHITCNQYREPPDFFAATADVELAHARWAQFRDGKEPLQAMAYFVLNLNEHRSNGRQSAAKTLRIDLKVLNRIGELSSTRGDATTARKAGYRPMSGPENSWLEAAVRKLIIRMGEHASGRSDLPEITLADLPPLQ